MASEPPDQTSNLHDKLSHLFETNPDRYVNSAGDVAIPARAMLSVLRAFSAEHGITLLKPQEEENLAVTTAAVPDLELTPALMIGFIEQLSGSLPGSSDSSSAASSVPVELGDTAPELPKKNGSPDSTKSNVFEARQRSGPLESGIPSSWKSRPQRVRGRSETGISAMIGSDNDSPTDGGRFGSGHRTMSNPSSPESVSSSSSPPAFPPRWSPSTSSYPQSPDTSLYEQSFLSSPIRAPDFAAMSDSDYYGSNSFSSVSSELFPHSDGPEPRHKPIHRRNASPSHSDDEDEGVEGDDAELTVQPRMHTISSVSMSSEDRIEALQRANAELAKKLRDASKELENKLSDHEGEIEEMQTRIEDLRSELQASKREEKELRIKSRTTASQLVTLEAEMSKLQRQLDAARASYQAMQKQYQEQCAISEKYRNTIRKKDQELKHAEDVASAHQHEINKWRNERELSEATIESLKEELGVAQQAQESLEEQKQANLMLKETIDRLRLDLDEIRTSTTAAAAGSTGSSARSTLTKNAVSKKTLASLAVELGETYQDDEEEEDGENEDDGETGSNYDGEEPGFVETIITTSRKRVGVRRGRGNVRVLEDIKEYSDAFAQHEISEFTATSSSQTEPLPVRSTVSISTQTSPFPSPKLRRRLEVSAQTEPRTSRDSLLDIDDDDSSSTSTLTAISPSPSPLKGKTPIVMPPMDLPPSYARLEAEEREKIGQEYIRRWHPGITSAPITEASTSTAEPPMLDVSREAVEEWKNLKRELGFECLAIDKVLNPTMIRSGSGSGSSGTISPVHPSSIMTMTPRLAREWASKVKAAAEAEEGEEEAANSQSHKKKTRRSPRRHFYNIYNAAFYPDAPNGDDAPRRNWNVVLTGVGVWAMVLMTAAVLPTMKSDYGEAMYTDRQLWSTYNSLGQVPTLDGFNSGGNAGGRAAGDAMWTVAERILFGAANVVRRAPPS